MKLASLKQGRDGRLVVVNRKMDKAVFAGPVASKLQDVLDDWAHVAPELEKLSEQLENNEIDSFGFDAGACSSPLPRAYHWVDGSAYVNHIELVRKSRNAEMPPSFWQEPIIYQGGSDTFLDPHGPIPAREESWGIDFEAEVSYVVDDVPMGVSVEQAESHIKLVMLVNDVSLRNLIAEELAKGFGFYQSKPSSAFSPVAVTLDELGDAWQGGKLHLPLIARLNGTLIGSPNAGQDMTFTPAQLIAHAAKTRALCAGTIVGTGTVSNVDRSTGSCCLAEVRMLEQLRDGNVVTSFMKYGDHVEIEMLDKKDRSIFGKISQIVEAA